MEDDKGKILRKLIQAAGPEKTDVDFTSSVMRSIQIETEVEFAKEVRLKSIISDIQPESAPPLFQRNIMAKVIPAKKMETEPIISHKVWYMIAAAALLILMFCFVSQPDAPSNEVPYPFSNLNSTVYNFSDQIWVLPVIYPAVVFIFGLLVMTDYFLRQQKSGLFSSNR